MHFINSSLDFCNKFMIYDFQFSSFLVFFFYYFVDLKLRLQCTLNIFTLPVKSLHYIVLIIQWKVILNYYAIKFIIHLPTTISSYLSQFTSLLYCAVWEPHCVTKCLCLWDGTVSFAYFITFYSFHFLYLIICSGLFHQLPLPHSSSIRLVVIELR